METNISSQQNAAKLQSDRALKVWSVIDDGQSWPHIAAEYLPDGTICEMSANDPQNEGNGDRARERALVNAHRIVCAVNSHEELLTALKWIMRDFVGDRTGANCQGGEMFDAARAAIARAVDARAVDARAVDAMNASLQTDAKLFPWEVISNSGTILAAFATSQEAIRECWRITQETKIGCGVFFNRLLWEGRVK